MSVNYYQYQACDAKGNMTTGQLSADTEREAIAKLQSLKLVPVKIKTTSRKSLESTGSKIKNADLVDFTNGLNTLVEARIPIDKALSLLEGITEKEHMKRMVVSLRRDVKEGKSLADAMEARSDVFSKLYINIVRAGETGGILDQLLPDLLNFLETAEDTRKQVISALTYPFVLLVTGILSVALLLIYVVPQFTAMFEDVGSEIPASAQFLLSLSVGMKTFGWMIIPAVFLLIYWWRWLNADKQRKRQKDAFLLGMPVVGRLLIHQDVAIFSRTLGALLGAGIPLIRGLRVAREVISNEELIYHLEVVEEYVRSGAGLGVSLEKTGLFPVLLHQLVTVGEESGRTGTILKKLASTFDASVRDDVNRLVSALQPALILLLGITVGGIIIVMLSAVFSMNTVDF
ncbi:MAG: type II secretion system F family protein [Gammaproteobacteria bacterium]|jgi:general secretion pathway protein F|nr:type II secretion system F family protein [Gammaproteobacteria bacterium]